MSNAASHSPHTPLQVTVTPRGSQGCRLSRIWGCVQTQRQYCRSPQIPFALWGLVLQEGGVASPYHECHSPLAKAVLPQPQPSKVTLYPPTGRAGEQTGQCCLGAGDGTGER